MIDRNMYNKHLDGIIAGIAFRHLENPITAKYLKNHILNMYGVPFNQEEIKNCLVRLAENNLFEEHSDPFTSSYYFKIDSHLENFFSTEANKRGSVIWKIVTIDGWEGEAIEEMGKINTSSLDENNLNTNEINKDKWEPLPLEYSGDAFENSVKGIENIIKEVAASNGYASEHPEERDSILITLKSGLDQINNKYLTKLQAQLIFSSLYQILKRFGDAILGETAKTVISSIRTWTGL